MAFFRRNLPTGILIGVAAGIAAKELFPRLGSAIRPMTKATLKGSLVAYEKVRETIAHVGESLEDLSSEVKAEMAAPTPQTETRGAAETSEAVPLRKSSDKESKSSRETPRPMNA